MMETADLPGIPMRSVMGPINYRPLKLLGSPGLIVEPPKHRTSIARIRLATPVQLRVVDSRDSSRSSWTGLPGSTPMEAEEAESSTPQSSVVSSVVVVDNKRVEKLAEASRTRYLEKVKELDLEDLECRQELAEVLGLKHVSHEDLSRHQCADWLNANAFLESKNDGDG